MVRSRLSRPLALGIALVLLLPVTLFGGIAPVRAAPPTISTSAGPANLVPFLTTAVTVAWDTGDGTVSTVCFAFNGSQLANFIGQSGTYSFALYPGAVSTCPAAAGPIVHVDLAKENPFPVSPGDIVTLFNTPSTGTALVTPAQPLTGVAPCPLPQPATSGSFGPSGGRSSATRSRGGGSTCPTPPAAARTIIARVTPRITSSPAR